MLGLSLGGDRSPLTPLWRRLLAGVLVIATLLTVGTLGFVLIEGHRPFDAFYLTLITITTIGYGEINGLSHAGRVFNSFLIMIGVTSVLLVIGALTQTVIELELGGYFRTRRIRRMIDNLSEHIIVCGYGRVGRGASEELRRNRIPFVIVDRAEDRVEMAIRAGHLAVLADSTRDETLKELAIERARGLICALATDADNLYVVLSAKALNPRLFVCARVSEEESERKLRRAGCDEVMAPYTITGSRLALSIVRPHVSEFFDFTTRHPDVNVSIEQVRVSESSEFVTQSLRQMALRTDLGVVVLAIRKVNGKMQFNPDAEAEVSAGDHLIVMGEDERLRQLERLMAARQ